MNTTITTMRPFVMNSSMVRVQNACSFFFRHFHKRSCPNTPAGNTYPERLGRHLNKYAQAIRQSLDRRVGSPVRGWKEGPPGKFAAPYYCPKVPSSLFRCVHTGWVDRNSGLLILGKFIFQTRTKNRGGGFLEVIGRIETNCRNARK